MILVKLHLVELPPPLQINITWAGQLNMGKKMNIAQIKRPKNDPS